MNLLLLWSGSLLLRRECCSFSNGEYLKAGLYELEQWCLKATNQVNLTYLAYHMPGLRPYTREKDSFSCIFFFFCCSFLDHLGMNSNTYDKLWAFWYTFLDKDYKAYASFRFVSFLRLTFQKNYFIYAGITSKDSEIFGWDHKWIMPGNLTLIKKSILWTANMIFTMNLSG